MCLHFHPLLPLWNVRLWELQSQQPSAAVALETLQAGASSGLRLLSQTTATVAADGAGTSPEFRLGSSAFG